MSKRLWLIAMVVLALSVFTFANELNTPTPFEVVSPKINTMGDVINSDELLISLKVNTSTPATLSLVRIDRSLMRMPRLESLVPVDKMLMQAPTDLVDVIVSPSGERSTVSYDPVPSVPQVDYSSMNHKEITEAYNLALEKLTSSYQAYNSAYDKLVLKYDAVRVNNWVKHRTLLVNNLNDFNDLRVTYEVAAKTFNAVRTEFNRKVRSVIVDEEPITLQGILPYYNRRIATARLGNYQLFVKDAESGRILLKATFNLIEQEQAAAQMLESVKVKMLDIWKVD